MHQRSLAVTHRKKHLTGRWLIHIGLLLIGALSKALEVYRLLKTFFFYCEASLFGRTKELDC